MPYKSLKNEGLEERKIEAVKYTEYCKVSKASKDLMLDRFYEGKRVEFPFK